MSEWAPRPGVPVSPIGPSAELGMSAELYPATTGHPHEAWQAHMPAEVGPEGSAADSAELVPVGKPPAVAGLQPVDVRCEGGRVGPLASVASAGLVGCDRSYSSLEVAAAGEVVPGSRRTSRGYSSMAVPVRMAESARDGSAGTGTGPWQDLVWSDSGPADQPAPAAALGRRVIQERPKAARTGPPTGLRAVPNRVVRPV